MSRIVITLALLATLAILLGLRGPLQAQKTGADPHPQRTALIDLASVFKGYDKFSALQSTLMTESENSRALAREKYQGIVALKTKLSELSGGTVEHERIRGELREAELDAQEHAAKMQLELKERESQIYRETYVEVVEAVQEHCRAFDYTLVLRFQRSELTDASSPEQVLDAINNDVVHYQSADDITEPIIDFLNRVHRNQEK